MGISRLFLAALPVIWRVSWSDWEVSNLLAYLWMMGEQVLEQLIAYLGHGISLPV